MIDSVASGTSRVLRLTDRVCAAVCLWSIAALQAPDCDLRWLSELPHTRLSDRDASGTVLSAVFPRQSHDKAYPSVQRWPSLRCNQGCKEPLHPSRLDCFMAAYMLNVMCRLPFLVDEPLRAWGGVGCMRAHAAAYLEHPT